MASFIEVLRSMRRRSVSLMMCPKCLGKQIRRAPFVAEVMLPPTYWCPECGYSGHIFLEKDSDGEDDEKA